MATDRMPPLMCTLSPGSGTPLFLIPSVGTTPLSVVRLARSVEPRRLVHSFAYAGLEDEREPHSTMEALAAANVAELVAAWPKGPCYLAGHCLGGAVVLEMAHQLEARGRSVPCVVVMDALAPIIDDATAPGDFEAMQPALREVFTSVIGRTFQSSSTLATDAYERLRVIVAKNMEAAVNYRGRPCKAAIRVVATEEGDVASGDRWERLSGPGFARYTVPGDTFSMLRPPHVDAVGRMLGRALDESA